MIVTVGLTQTDHTSYSIIIDKDKIKIILKTSDESYDIRFTGDDFRQYHVSIIGDDCSVFICAQLKCVGMHVNCKYLITEDTLALTAKYFSVDVCEGEIGGKIDVSDIEVAIKQGGAGIVNYGQVYVSRLYRQNNNTFINKNIFYAYAIDISKGGLILNDVNGSWHSQNQVRIDGVSFINFGRFSGDIIRITCQIIEIRNKFSCSVSELMAAVSLHIDVHAQIVCTMQWYADAKEYISVEGEFFKANHLRFISNNVNIASTAKFIECQMVESVAYDTLKIEANIEFRSVNQFVARARCLDVAGDITALQRIDLDGRAQQVIHEKAVLTSALIVFKGLRVFLHCRIRGQVEFPQHMEHLYLAESSSIDSSDKIKVSANLIESLGKLLTFARDFNATFAVLDGEQSSLSTVASEMRAAYIKLAGKYAASKFETDAKCQIGLLDTARLANGESFLSAPFVSLAGELHGAVDAKADTLTTRAKIINHTTTKLKANKISVTELESSVSTRDIDYNAPVALVYGEVMASGTCNEQGSEIFHADTSHHQARINNITGDHVAMAGHFEGDDKSSVVSSQVIHLLPGNTVTGGPIKMQANHLYGTPGFNNQSAEFIGVKSVDLRDGGSLIEEVLTVASRDVYIESAATAKEIRLIQVQDENAEVAAHVRIAPGANLTAETLVENFQTASIAGTVTATEVHLQTPDSLAIEETANVTFRDQLQMQSARNYIAGKIERPADDENKGIMQVVGEKAIFDASSTVTSSVPVRVSSDESVYSGALEVAVLHNESDDTTFTAGSNVSDKSGDIITVGKTDKATVAIHHGAVIGGKSFNTDKIDELEVAGTVATKVVRIKGNKLKITKTGKLGTMETQMLVDVSYLMLYGTLEADEARLKIARAFVQSGFHGKALLRARKLAIDSVFYFNILGRTSAHTATINSLVSLSIALEFINFKASNSIISLGTGINLRHPKFFIEAIQNNNLDFLSPQFLQYSLQVSLSFLQPFLPTVTLAANTALSAFFLYSNLAQSVELINELRKKNDLGEEIRIVDMLSLMVSMKNSASAGASLYNNGTALVDALKDKILDNLKDLGQYIGEDLENDIRSKLGSDPERNDSEHPSVTKDKNEQTVENKKGHKKDHKKDDSKEKKKEEPVPTTWENLQKWWHDLDGYDFAHDTFSKYVLPPLAIFMPATYDDAIFNLRFGQAGLGFIDVQRGVFTIDAASPAFAFISNRTGYYFLGDYGRNFAYTEILSGYHVEKSGDSFAHNYSVYSHDYNQASGTKVRAGNLYIKESDFKPHDAKGKHATFEYSTTKNEEDFLKLVGAYDIMAPDDPAHSSVSYRAGHDLKFYHNIQLDWSVTYAGTNVFVDHGVKLKSVNGSLGLVSTKGSIEMNGDLEAKETIFEDSTDRIDHHHGTTKSKKLYEHSRNNIMFVDSKGTCEEGVIVSDRTDVTVTNSKIQFTKSGAVIAHDTVKVEKHGELKGGDKGLYVEARKIWNVASYIGAKGDCYIKGRSLLGEAETHQHTSHHRHKKLFGLKSSNRVTTTLNIDRPVFASDDGTLVINVDHIKTTAAEYKSQGPTIITTLDAPEFLDIAVHTDTHKSSSIAGVTYKKQHHVEDKRTGQKFHNDEALYVKCQYDNIVFRNCDIKTKVLVTEAVRGGTFVVWDKTENLKETDYLSARINCGPLSYSFSADPDNKHPHQFRFEDPLLSSGDAISQNKGVGKVTSVVNAVDTVAGKLNGPLVSSSVGVSVGFNHRVERYQAMNKDNHLDVDVWHDFSEKGIGLDGVAASIGMVDIHRGGLRMEGQMMEFSSNTTSATVGASFDPITNRLDANASITNFKAEGRVAAPCQLNVGRLIFREEATISLNNAQLRVHDLHGTVNNVNMTSAYDDTRQSMSTVSASTNGNFNIAHSETVLHQASSVSCFDVTDMSDATIRATHETKLTGSTSHTKGFAIAGNGMTHSVTSVGVTSLKNNHGTDATFAMPTQAINAINRFFAPPPPPPPSSSPSQRSTVVNIPSPKEADTDCAKEGVVKETPQKQGTQQPQKAQQTQQANQPQQSQQKEPVTAVSKQNDEQTHEQSHDHEHEHGMHYLTPKENKEIFGFMKTPTEKDFSYHGNAVDPYDAFVEGIHEPLATSKSFKSAARYPLFAEESTMRSYVYTINKNYSLYDEHLSVGDIKGATEINRCHIDGQDYSHTREFIENPNYVPRSNFNLGHLTYGGLAAGCYLYMGYSLYEDGVRLHDAYEMSERYHTPRPLVYESTRAGFCWSGAIAMGSYTYPIIEAGVASLELSNPVSAAVLIGATLFASNAGGHGGNYASERFLRSAEVAADCFNESGKQLWSNAKFAARTFYDTGNTLFHAMQPPPPAPVISPSPRK